MNKNERKCPKCGSTEIVLGLFHESDDKPHLIYRTWRCWKCRCAVKEYYRYRLVGSERIDDYDEWNAIELAPVD